MKNSFYLIAFVLALAAAYAVSQTAPAPDPATPNSTARSATTTQPDATLQTQVQRQFAAQNFTNVTVAASAGVVTLTGSVPAKEDRQRVKELAKAVPGVKKVEEKLTINASASSAPAPANTAGSLVGNTTAASGTQVAESPAPATSAPAIGAATTTTAGTPATSTASLSSPAESADLQVKIGSALKSEPTLSTSNVLVNVSGDAIELSGSVPTGKEKVTAKRIAQSFAGNRKVVDRVTVAGRGNAAVTTTTPPDQTPKR